MSIFCEDCQALPWSGAVGLLKPQWSQWGSGQQKGQVLHDVERYGESKAEAGGQTERKR